MQKRSLYLLEMIEMYIKNDVKVDDKLKNGLL